MHTITVPIDSSVSPEILREVCEQSNCQCERAGEEGNSWRITTEAPENFFLLGLNLHDHVQDEQACRKCGCAEHSACYDSHVDGACHWVESDLCSACAPKPCRHEGCTVGETETIRCSLYDPGFQVNAVEWLCPAHASEEGYCYGCGNFYAGTGELESHAGMCSNCYSDMADAEYELNEDPW